ncbi:MAG: phosphatase PAP2 family protein [Sporolactobacillus sp.]
MHKFKSNRLQKVGSVVGCAGFIAMAVGVETGMLQPLDNACFFWAEQHWTHAVKKIMKGVDHFLSPAHLLIAAILVGLFLILLAALSKKTETAIDLRCRAVLLFSVSACSYVLNTVLKHLFQRPRPLPGAHFSFPSDHAMMAFALFMTVAVITIPYLHKRSLRLLILFVAAIVTAFIGLSRVYLGKHYLSDVIAGYFLTWFVLSVCRLAIARVRAHR